MEILKEIEIRNFRGIKNIKFKPKSINIIVGPNNCGKSAILEAIALFVSFPNDFRDVMGKDLFEYLCERYGKYILKTNSNKAEIKGKLRKREYILNFEYYAKGFPSDEKGELISRYFTNNEAIPPKFFIDLLSKPQKNIKSDAEIFRDKLNRELLYDVKKYVISLYNNQSNLKSIHIVMNSEDLQKNLEKIASKQLKNELLLTLISFEISSHNVVMKFNKRGFKKYPVVFNKMMYSTEELHDMVIKNKYIENDINDIIEFIKEKIFYIEDIRRTKEGIYVKTSNENEYMPLSTMGDGFKALLKMSFIMALAKDGVVILEEPENSLHPRFLDIVAETLVKSSDSVQLFLSTHSLEFLYEILEKAEELEKLNEVNIIRTHRKRYKPDDVIIEVVDGKEAKERIDDIGEDLRLG